MSGLEGVLAAHRFSKGIAECACGVELGGRGHRTEAHRAHVAAEVRAWLASELADVTAVLDEWDREPSLPPSTYNLVDDVRTALTAVRAHLAGEA